MTETKETFQFNWTVQRLSSYEGRVIVSPSFQAPEGSYKWHLTLFPKFQKSEYYLDLIRIGDTSRTLNLKGTLQVALLDRGGRPWKEEEMKDCDFKRNLNGLPILFPEDLRWAEVVEDDMLRIQCCIWIQEGEGNHETTVMKAKVNGFEDLFGGLMNDSDFADVTLVTNTKTFTAHKAILAARSKVFRAMFKSPMEEASSGVVNISDFDEEAVEGMLQHIYKDQVDNLGDKARSLLQISEKYDLPPLKKECEVNIANSLTVETVADDLVLAHMLNATLLKGKVVHFINRNKDNVRKTESFQNFLRSDPGLLLDLLYLSSGSEQL